MHTRWGLFRDVRAVMNAARLASAVSAVFYVTFPPTAEVGASLSSGIALLVGLLLAAVLDRHEHERLQVGAAALDVILIVASATVVPLSPFGSFSPLGMLLVAGWAARRSIGFALTFGLATALPLSAWQLLLVDPVDWGQVIGPVGTLPWLGLMVGYAFARQREALALVEEQAAQLLLAQQEAERFAGRISHDLRSPLAGMSGFATLLRSSLPDDAGQSLELVDYLQASIGDLSSQVDSLYLMSVAPHMQLQMTRIDMVETVLNAADKAVPDGRGLELSVLDLPDAHGDPQLVRLVLQNLLSNAARHGRRPGTDPAPVEVTVQCAGTVGDRVVYEVHDNGPGLDEDARGAAIEHGVSGTETGRSGLGLSTVATVVRRHGGTLALDEGPEGGLLVRFDLPCWPPADQAD